MNVEPYFSPDYATARRRFREAAATCGWRLDQREGPARGPSGEPLWIDAAVSPSPGDRALVVSSGLHGIRRVLWIGGPARAPRSLALVHAPPLHLRARAQSVRLRVAAPYRRAERRSQSKLPAGRRALRRVARGLRRARPAAQSASSAFAARPFSSEPHAHPGATGQLRRPGGSGCRPVPVSARVVFRGRGPGARVAGHCVRSARLARGRR